jgi:hypothetical protein
MVRFHAAEEVAQVVPMYREEVIVVAWYAWVSTLGAMGAMTALLSRVAFVVLSIWLVKKTYRTPGTRTRLDLLGFHLDVSAHQQPECREVEPQATSNSP